MIQLTDKHYAIEAPDDACKPTIIGNELGDNWTDEEFELWEVLPEGSYQFLFLSNSVTEEEAAKVVEKYDYDPYWMPSYYDPDSGGKGCAYADYQCDDLQSGFYTALESFASLLKSKHLTGNFAVLIKK